MAVTTVVLVCVKGPEKRSSQNGKHDDAHSKCLAEARQPGGILSESAPKVKAQRIAAAKHDEDGAVALG
jgi:hypothetical protein